MTDKTTAAPTAPAGSPLMVAWNSYKATESYQDTRCGAMHEQHVDSSLWAAFNAGYTCRAATPSPVDGTILSSRITRAAQVLGNRIDMGNPLTDARRECVEAIGDLNEVAEALERGSPVDGGADVTEVAKRIAHTWSNTRWPGTLIGTPDDFWEALEVPHRDAWLSAARAVQPQPTPTDSLPLGFFSVPADLHEDTARLVAAFATALAAKLRLAEAKYGYSDGWKRDDWRDELVGKLLEHVLKGDPRDVAAYCAFAWHHGWSITPPVQPQPSADVHETLNALLRHLEGMSDDASACEGISERMHPGNVMACADAAADLCRTALSALPSAGQPAGQRAYPDEAPAPLMDALGLMIMQTCPIAHRMRAAGHDIPRKTEAEQAYVLHWLIKLALDHGDQWRKEADAQLRALLPAAPAPAEGVV